MMRGVGLALFWVLVVVVAAFLGALGFLWALFGGAVMGLWSL